MDSDLALVNGKSARQSWCYADTFESSIISGAIYCFYIFVKQAKIQQMFQYGCLNSAVLCGKPVPIIVSVTRDVIIQFMLLCFLYCFCLSVMCESK